MCKRLVETILLFCGRIIESTHPTKRCKRAEEKGSDCDDLEQIWSFQRKDEKAFFPGKERKKQSKDKGNGKKEKAEFTEEQKEELRRLKAEVELSNDLAILAIFQG